LRQRKILAVGLSQRRQDWHWFIEPPVISISRRAEWKMQSERFEMLSN